MDAKVDLCCEDIEITTATPSSANIDSGSWRSYGRPAVGCQELFDAVQMSEPDNRNRGLVSFHCHQVLSHSLENEGKMENGLLIQEK